jgi:hypothetical protein
MIGLVTEQARQQVAAAEEVRRQEALKGRRYKEVPDGENGTRLVPARMGTAPLLTANDPDTEDETGDKIENSAFKTFVPGVTSDPRATLAVQGDGPVAQALAGHVYGAQRNAQMPTPLADLQTTAALMCSGPAFEPGTATVQQQNHRAPTGAFPQVHAPGQVPFHTAPINTGSQR